MPGFPSRSVPFEKLPDDCHAKQQNRHRRTVGMRYVENMPPTTPPSPQTHTHYLHPTSFLSPLSPNFSVCYLYCSTFSFPVLFVSVLHVWAPVSAACAGGQPNSFLLYLFPNPITQPGWDCPSFNGKRIRREIGVGNNKPTCHEDKSIFKALGFSRTTAQKSITSCIFWLHYCITPRCYIWLS